MKKRNVTLLMIAIILVGMTSLCHAYVAYYSLFVVSGEDYPGRIYQLKILPNGQILDTYIQYTTIANGFGSALAVSPKNRFLFASGDVIYRFQIQSDGSLVSIGSTTPADSVAITPNEQLDIGGNTIYSLTSTGDLVNGISISSLGIDYPYIDPLGRGILGISSISTFSAYTINYNSRTLSLMTTYPLGNGNYYSFTFTPDGKLGFLSGFGVSPSGGDLWVLNIDSVFNVTTTSQILNIPNSIGFREPVISQNNKYLWGATGAYGIALLTIDITGRVTDTGQHYSEPGWAVGFPRVTPDEQLALVFEEIDVLQSGAFATAFINGDGSLTWTGYTFAFDSVYPTLGEVLDYAIVPVYATGIPEELWKDPPPEMIIHDSQKILRNP